MRTTLRLAGLAVAGTLVLAGCSDVPADVAATVNGEEIPVDELERLVRRQLASPQLEDLPDDQRVAQTDSIQQQVLQGLIQAELLEGAIRDRGIEATPEEVEDRWQTEIGIQGGEENLRALLDEAGLSEEEARERLATLIRQEKFQASFEEEVEVPEDEIRALYEERRDQYEQVDTAHILLETRAEAQEVLDLLADGADFAELATERSTDPSAEVNQGDLGPVPVTQLDPDYVNPLRDAEPGELVGPVETQFGFHVIRFEGFQTTSFEAVRDQLRDELAGGRSQEGFAAFITELLERSTVEINARFGRWDAVNAAVLPPAAVGDGSQNP